MLLILIIIRPVGGRPFSLLSDPASAEEEEEGWVNATSTSTSSSSPLGSEGRRVRRNLRDPDAEAFAADSRDLIHYIAYKEEGLQSEVFDLRRLAYYTY